MPQRLFTKHPQCPLKPVLALGYSSEPEDKVSVSTDKAEDRITKTNNNNKNLKMPGCVNKEQGDMET